MKGLEHLSYEERLTGTVQPGKEKIQRYVTSVCKYLMGKDEEEGARLLVVPTTGKEEVTKIKNHEIPSEHKETLFSCGVDKYQQRLLR